MWGRMATTVRFINPTFSPRPISFPLNPLPLALPPCPRAPPYPDLAMSTQRQILANRANAARSRGPVTAEGKRRSSLNGLRHGMLAQTVVLEGESYDRFDQLLQAFIDEVKPRSPREAALVETMAIARWRQMRVWGIQKAMFDLEMDRPENSAAPPPVRAAIVFRDLTDSSRVLDLVLRYETAFDRQFARAVSLLLKIRIAARATITLGEFPLYSASVTWEPELLEEPQPEFPHEPNSASIEPLAA